MRNELIQLINNFDGNLAAAKVAVEAATTDPELCLEALRLLVLVCDLKADLADFILENDCLSVISELTTSQRSKVLVAVADQLE